MVRSDVAAPRLPARTRLAARLGAGASTLSRSLGGGDGTVIGGRVTLLADRKALARLGAGRWTALVSGTNGKTTTTRLLAASLSRRGPVATNPQGSNLLPGLVAGLSRAARQPSGSAALEVDEAWLEAAAAALEPQAIVLLNLSRDQLDRVAEVRRLADRWHRVVAAHPSSTVVANADDPLVAWAASAASAVRWVAAGQPWQEDATGCPSCGGHIAFDPTSGAWACTACPFKRPEPSVRVSSDDLTVDGATFPITLSLPGRANRANAAMAATAAELAGVPWGDSLAAMRDVAEIDGRYRRARVRGVDVRLLLAKNPAGWVEIFDMLAPAPGPIVVVINARTADGRDPSWLWDVPFERLAGRRVVAAGERSRDLAARLSYAGVDYRRVDDPINGIGALAPGPVDVAANYTAMRDINHRLGRSDV
jgi:UDP-N-acetylmuramyl tripeptide synthase